jgi:hypothetical protein
MPFFFRHSRSARNRPGLAAPGSLPGADVVGVVVAAALALVVVVEEELFEEPPHAASSTLASARRTTATAVGVRLRLLLS